MITNVDPSKQYLLVGIDPGNSDTKLSYLNTQGTVVDMTIPTCIADAPSEPIMSGKRNNDPTDWLHIEISATNGAFSKRTCYVGTIAKMAKEKRTEPVEGNNKATSDVHLITQLVGEAVAALENGYRGTVNIPPSCGLPVNDVKDRQATVLLGRLRGNFTIKFLDGKYKGETITIIHEIPENAEVEDYVHAEAIQCTLGLGFDVDKFELKENENTDYVDQDVVISDAGGGTFDIAVYENESLDPEASRTYRRTLPEFAQIPDATEYADANVGANEYIDKIITDSIPEIKKQLEDMGIPVLDSTEFFRGRNEYLTKVLKPYTMLLEDAQKKTGETKKANDLKEPRITYDTMGVQVDLTDVVKPTLEKYGNMLHWMNIVARQQQGAASIPNNIITGGGVLLAYVVLKDKQVNDKGVRMFKLPADLFSAPFTNSRGYLYSAMLTHKAIIDQLKNQNSTVA